MKYKLFFITGAILLAGLLVFFGLSTTTYYIVRHAEKTCTSCDELSNIGHKRAVALRDLLKTKSISRIFISETTRSRQTAQPLATALSITPLVYSTANSAGLINQLSAIEKRKVLVVGHTTNLPPIVVSLSISSIFSIPEDDFDNLYTIRLTRFFGFIVWRTLHHTTYGQTSP